MWTCGAEVHQRASSRATAYGLDGREPMPGCDASREQDAMDAMGDDRDHGRPYDGVCRRDGAAAPCPTAATARGFQVCTATSHGDPRSGHDS